MSNTSTLYEKKVYEGSQYVCKQGTDSRYTVDPTMSPLDRVNKKCDMWNEVLEGLPDQHIPHPVRKVYIAKDGWLSEYEFLSEEAKARKRKMRRDWYERKKIDKRKTTEESKVQAKTNSAEYHREYSLNYQRKLRAAKVTDFKIVGSKVHTGGVTVNVTGMR